MEQLLIEAIAGSPDLTAILVSPELYAELHDSEMVTRIGESIWCDGYEVWMQPELDGQRVLVAYG